MESNLHHQIHHYPLLKFQKGVSDSFQHHPGRRASDRVGSSGDSITT
ncbi:unnamed protein product [Acanthoscelides obtectus]|uniref:Uncharacterized protein n=1 Tax=Acanthoscelides obtectus TaxID=200917 RepID=A0A9P0KEN8_ACAOB|nr:unnamed protein product [Acanthoscelides obtectus]CAK1648425.1 hypothetical protein AOBTE_LOCUS15705 [Acanthoscelides obtectus]